MTDRVRVKVICRECNGHDTECQQCGNRRVLLRTLAPGELDRLVREKLAVMVGKLTAITEPERRELILRGASLLHPISVRDELLRLADAISNARDFLAALSPSQEESTK